MDINQSFNSESTYCSAYENSKESVKSLKIKCKKISKGNSSSQLLDKIHNEVLLHLEGKLLMGRIQVQNYMKKISRMSLKNAKDQYFAEKIQSSLIKIFKLTKQFEKSLSLSQISMISDPLKYHTCTENLKILENNKTDDPMHVLIGSATSVNCEDDSFPLDLLTNNNFISLTPQNSNIPIDNSAYPIWENQVTTKAENNKCRVVSSELFSSENTEFYLEHSREGSILFRKPLSCKRDSSPDMAVHSTKEPVTTTTFDEICIYGNNESKEFVDNCQNNENKKCSERNIISKSISDICNNNIPSVNSFLHGHNVKESSDVNGKNNVNIGNSITDMLSKNEVALSNSNNRHDVPERLYDVNEICTNKEFNDIALKIMDLENHSVQKTDISERFCDQASGSLNVNVVKKANLKTIIKLGDFFDESYNKRIGKVCYGLGKESENKTWQEIHNELENEKKIPRSVNHTLIKLFEKLSLTEHEHNEREYKKKLEGKGGIHNFSEEDNKKIDWESLIRKNEAKLESISEEFGGYLILGRVEATDMFGDNDFDGLDWRKLLE